MRFSNNRKRVPNSGSDARLRQVSKGDRRRWGVLAVSTAAQAATSAYFLGLAAVAPALRVYYDISLPALGALLGVASLGVLGTLILWGSLTDRFGERPVMVLGLTGAAGFLWLAAGRQDVVAVGALLVAAGAAGASVNAASGRAVLGWFPARRRGLAMAVRQTSVPLGAAVAAVALPMIVGRGGVPAVFLALAGSAAVVAVAVAIWVRDPPRDPASARPGAPGAPVERGPVRETFADRRLWRLSAAAALLVVPHALGSMFMVELLHTRHGVALAVAGGLLALTQALAVLGRLGAGVWSDRVGRRLGPLRVVALVIVGGFALAAALDRAPVPLLAAVLVPAAAVAISWNGLAFTATGEMVPRRRVGTALAFENSANYLSAAVTPLIGGAVAQAAGWSAMLVTGALAAAVAWLLLGPLARTERPLPPQPAGHLGRQPTHPGQQPTPPE